MGAGSGRVQCRKAGRSHRRVLLATALAAASVGWAPTATGQGQPTFTTTTSTTYHETHTPVTAPTEVIETHATRVTGVVGRALVFDATVGGAPGSADVQAALAEAAAAVRAGGGTPGDPVTVSSQRALVNSQQVLSAELTHTETSVTTTTTFGPATILIGEDQSQTFFVPAGTTNVNTNTHTEAFFDDVTATSELYRTTTHLQVGGDAEPVDPPAPASPTVAPAAAPAPPIPGRPAYAG